jgi:hypothetical protein
LLTGSVLAEQEEELIDGVRISSAGIHLCQLPYADDVREHGLTSTLSIIEPPSELVASVLGEIEADVFLNSRR